MKKTVSVLLAVLLMFSLSVSAFAANLTPSADKTAVKAGETVTVTLSLDEDIANTLTIAYKLYFDASLFDVTSSKSTVDGGYVTMSTVKTNEKGSYVNLSTMDTTSEGQLLKAGSFAQVTFTAKAEAAPGQASFTAEYENSMNTSFGSIADMGAGPAVTVTVTREYSVTVSGAGAADVTAAEKATYGTAYSFTLNKAENYDYTVAVTVGGESVTPTLGEDGKTYTVAGASITGDIAITVTKTAKQYNVTYAFESDYGTDKSWFEFGNLNPTKATYGQDLSFDVDGLDETKYVYTVEITIGGRSYTGFTTSKDMTDDLDVKIPGADITGDIAVKVLEKNKPVAPTTTTVTFTGSGAGDVAGGTSQTAANGQDFTFTVNKAANYDYTVKLDGETLTESNGQYTIPAAKLTGTALTVTVTKTAKTPEITTTTVTFTGSGSGDVKNGTTQTAANGQDFSFSVNKDASYDYTVKLGEETLTESNGQYTIPAAKLTGAALTVTVTKTAKTPEKTEDEPLPTPVGPKPGKKDEPTEPGTTEPGTTEPGTTEPGATEPVNPFTDVPAGAYYEEAVIWAAEKGITKGASETTFAPKALCTRAQVVTFLWRAAGCPEPQSGSSFTDVTAGSYYAKAVAWAIENGITDGTGDGLFSPDAVCTRAQAVTFLYRASSAADVGGSISFSDVAADAYYAAAVRWAEQNGITDGIGGGLFGTELDCTREQIITFMFRLLMD